MGISDGVLDVGKTVSPNLVGHADGVVDRITSGFSVMLREGEVVPLDGDNDGTKVGQFVCPFLVTTGLTDGAALKDEEVGIEVGLHIGGTGIPFCLNTTFHLAVAGVNRKNSVVLNVPMA